MENEEHISLDPDVVENSFDSRIPLSSLYGFSAFSEAAEEEAAERDAAKKKNLEQIGRKIFFVTENRESEKLEQLHSRVFQIMPEFQMTEGAGMPEEEREFSGILLITAFMTAAILLLLFLREAEDMMLTIVAEDKELDIIVRKEQRIQEVCDRLFENGYISQIGGGRRLQVYSVRRNAYVAAGHTFSQEEIYNGDILRIE